MMDSGIKIPNAESIRKERINLNELDVKILELYKNGEIHTQTELAEILHTDQPRISLEFKKMKKMGIEFPDHRKKSMPKVSKEDIVKGILRLEKTKGATEEQMIEIAKIYGVEENVDALLKEIAKEKSGGTR